MKRMVIGLLLLALPAVARAGDPREQLKTAVRHFDYQEYDKARALAEELLQNNELSTAADLVQANRIAGLCWFYAQDRVQARPYFVNLLRTNPDYEMDPFFTPPDAVEFFEQLKRDPELKPELDRIRERIRQEARRRQLEADAARQPKVEVVNRDVEEHHRALAFLPLGVGQFQNGDTGLGVAVGSIQAVSGLASVGCYLAVSVMNSQHPAGLPAGRLYDTAAGLRTTSVVTGGIFFATWIYGVAQALSGFEPEIITQSPGGLHAGDAKKDKSESASSLFVTPFAAPVPGGGVAGVGLGF